MIRKELKKHLVDSTAILAVSHPVVTGLQTLLAGVSNATSIGNRLLTTALTYGGLGRAYSYGRDKSKKWLKINENSPEWAHAAHGMIYNSLFNAVITPPLLIVPELISSSNPDWGAIGYATALQVGYGAISGAPIEYSIETARHLTGIEESKRITKLIGKKSIGLRKGLAALVLAGSLATTAGIYAINRNNQENKIETHSKEQEVKDYNEKFYIK